MNWRWKSQISDGNTYFRTIRKSTAVVRMTKLENSTAMAWNRRKHEFASCIAVAATVVRNILEYYIPALCTSTCGKINSKSKCIVSNFVIRLWVIVKRYDLIQRFHTVCVFTERIHSSLTDWLFCSMHLLWCALYLERLLVQNIQYIIEWNGITVAKWVIIYVY